MSDKPNPMPLDECVREFLKIALMHPEKAPKTYRAERDNSMMIIGFNKAQEALRTILANHGQSAATKALADVRSDSQQRPMDGPGGVKMWVAG